MGRARDTFRRTCRLVLGPGRGRDMGMRRGDSRGMHKLDKDIRHKDMLAGKDRDTLLVRAKGTVKDRDTYLLDKDRGMRSLLHCHMLLARARLGRHGAGLLLAAAAVYMPHQSRVSSPSWARRDTDNRLPTPYTTIIGLEVR